eukprot:4678672-Prymnesium_polylepis.1
MHAPSPAVVAACATARTPPQRCTITGPSIMERRGACRRVQPMCSYETVGVGLVAVSARPARSQAP